MRKRWAWLVFLIPATLPGAEWNADLAAAKTGAFVHAEKTFASSTSLRVTWAPPAAAVYKFIAVAAGERSTVQADAPGDARELTLQDLKAGTAVLDSPARLSRFRLRRVP